MALVDPSTGRLFRAYARSRASYDAQHERLMEHLKKYGYEKPQHKNVSAAPQVIPTKNVIVEPPERPVLPVRGRMNAPDRAATNARATMDALVENEMRKEGITREQAVRRVNQYARGIMPPYNPKFKTVRAQRIHEIMTDENVDRTEATRRYNRYLRTGGRPAVALPPDLAAAVMTTVAPAPRRRGRRPAAAATAPAAAAAAEPEIKINSIVYKKDKTDVGAEAAPKRARSKPVETESKGSQAKPQSVMSKAWELKKANPTMSLSEALKKAHGK